MNFQLCGSLISVDNLFNCFGKQNHEIKDEKVSRFTLLIDKRLDDYPFILDLENMRVSIIDDKCTYLNIPNHSGKLPLIFLDKQVKGKTITSVIHHEVSVFYENFTKTIFEKKNTHKVHIILNDIHILLIGVPVLDNNEKLVGCNLMEIPFMNTEELVPIIK